MTSPVPDKMPDRPDPDLEQTFEGVPPLPWIIWPLLVVLAAVIIAGSIR